MKTITLTDNQFEQLKDYVIGSCESIMERSFDWGDSDYANSLIEENEIIFEFREIIEQISDSNNPTFHQDQAFDKLKEDE